jgi:hypothetical protein
MVHLTYLKTPTLGPVYFLVNLPNPLIIYRFNVPLSILIFKFVE